MADSLIQKEIQEIAQYIKDSTARTIVFRDERKLEVISDDLDSIHNRMRQRFDTEEAATVAVVGEGIVTEVYDVPNKYEDFGLVVFEIRETRSERGLEPVVSNDENLRPLLKTEIQDIDHQLRESDMHLDGLTKELYEDLQKFQVPDDGQ